MATIEEILSQRSDLSTFLVHLTKDNGSTPAYDILKAILQSQKIEARSPFGQALKALGDAHLPKDSQNCVCFTETPLVHLRLLLGTIDGRQVNLQPYGIAIPKKVGRKASVNPVWYLDMTPNAPGWLTIPFNQIIKDAIANNAAVPFDQHPIAQLAPFIEQMGTWSKSKSRKEFWWEREWRKRGDFTIPHRVIVVAPEEKHAELKQFIDGIGTYSPTIKLIDASWSLEQIIGGLAGFQPADLGL
jgi:hypothetical protein